MKLSTKSRYACRLMVNLALVYQQGPIQLNEIAKREDISEKYLSQIVILLRGSGLIRSVRGAKGGYLLTKGPESITLRDIVEVMEGGLNIVDCLDESEPCGRSGKCLTRQVWNKVSQAIKDTLEGITLKDLAEQIRNPENVMYYI